jgi:hypothetical protein
VVFPPPPSPPLPISWVARRTAAAILELREELTVEAWIKPEGSGEAESILFKEAAGEWFGYTHFLGLQASSKVEGLIGDSPSSAPEVVSPSTIPTSVWTHVAMTYDGRHMRLYVNGQLVDTELSDAPIPNTGPLRIGCSQEHETGFDGKIDEVRVYERVVRERELDYTPPSSPEQFEALLENAEGDATIYWTPSIDNPSPGSGAATGVAEYRYRYHRSGVWSGWQSTTMPFFEISSASESEPVEVQVQAVDRALNRSSVAHGKVTVEESTLSQENVGEEARPEEWRDVDLLEEPKHPGIDQHEEEEEAKGAALLGPHPNAVLGSNELCEGEGEKPCGTYHPKLAAEYPYKFVNEKHPENYNHEFQYFGGAGGDCTNFTSQVLWAGGMRFARTHGYNEPDVDANGEEHYGDYEYGQGSWWEGYYYLGDGKESKFSRTPTLSFVNAETLRDHLVEYGLIERVAQSAPLRRGDVIFYDEHLEKTDKLSHSQTVVAVTPEKIWVGQHSTNYVATLRSVRHRVDNERGPQGTAWEMYVYRPVHTKANLSLP